MPLRIGPLIVRAALVFLLAGCATPPQTRALLQDDHHDTLTGAVELGDIPFFPQEDRQCGPAALATVLSAGGMTGDPGGLRRQVYLPGLEGSLQVEMLAAARRNGAVTYLLEPNLRVLLAEVAAGTPVVVLQNLGLSWYPVWHYAVVVGYDLSRGEVLLRSGRERRQVLGLATFERTWARGGHWAFVALPPGRLPAGATEAAYLAAVAPLEGMGQTRAARQAYGAALQRWPDSLGAAIGLGNTAYALGDLGAAEAAFRRASLNHPASAVAHNNLAHVLARMGHHDEALEAARRAVELGGPHVAAARRTLAGIEAARR